MDAVERAREEQRRDVADLLGSFPKEDSSADDQRAPALAEAGEEGAPSTD